jgi:hypothetical protein
LATCLSRPAKPRYITSSTNIDAPIANLASGSRPVARRNPDQAGDDEQQHHAPNSRSEVRPASTRHSRRGRSDATTRLRAMIGPAPPA